MKNLKQKNTLFKFKSRQLLIQLTFATGNIRWGWPPPQFFNATITP